MIQQTVFEVDDDVDQPWSMKYTTTPRKNQPESHAKGTPYPEHDWMLDPLQKHFIMIFNLQNDDSIRKTCGRKDAEF